MEKLSLLSTDSCFCPAFEENAWKKGRCRNCFHAADRHYGGRCNAALSLPAPPEDPAPAAPDVIELVPPLPPRAPAPPIPSAAVLAGKEQPIPADSVTTDMSGDASESMSEAADARRRLAARELLDTEKSYLTALEQLVTAFEKPAREKGVLTQEQCSALFSNAESLSQLHTELLARLKEEVDKEAGGSIATVFIKLGPMLRLYKVYSANYNFALQTLEGLCKQDKWTGFCRKSMGEGSDASESFVLLRLTSLLITPVQRIPRYILLLQDILAHTSADDHEHAKLSKALNLLSEIAAEVNQHMSRSELYTKALQIQHSLVGSGIPHLLEAHRVFVREGDLHKITSRFVTTCRVFLFNDILVYSHQKIGWAWKYKGSQMLGPCWTRELPDTPKIHNLFQLVCPKKTWTFYAATPAEKTAWVRDLNRLIDALVHKDPTLVDERNDVRVTERAKIWKAFSKTTIDRVDPEYRALKQEQDAEDGEDDTAKPKPPKARKGGELAQPLLFVADQQPGEDEDAAAEKRRCCSCCTIL